MGPRALGVVAAILLLAAAGTRAQVSDRISRVQVGAVHPGEPLGIQVELIQPDQIERIEIAYRPFGQTDFTHAEMAVAGNAASVELPAATTTSQFLEYYFILAIRGKSTPETYPVENPEQQPLKISLTPAPVESKLLTILSPDPSEVLDAADVLISCALLRPDSAINRRATKILLDGVDLSAGLLVSGDLILIRPENITPGLSSGPHSVQVLLFDTTGRIADSAAWRFTVRGREVIPPPSAARGPWSYNGSVQQETRNETIANSTTPYNRAGLSAAGMYNDFRVDGRLYLTNEEKDDRQPQNRYFIGATSPWLKVGYGDSYPVFPGLIMNGRRIRGLVGNLTLGTFNFDITNGETVRRIESDTLRTFPFDSLQAQQRRDSSGLYGLYDPAANRWAQFQYGTFSRSMLVIHPSFGSREGSHIGFTYLRASDDTNSVLFGINPEQNLVLGSDLFLAFDHHNVEISAEGAVSATNQNIRGGNFSDAFIDSNYQSADRQRIRQIRDFFSNFITVNQNLIPLSMTGTPTLAYEGSLALNYFNNNFRAQVLRHGEHYESFGQLFIRPDVAGFNISDRLRLMENQLFVSAGVERLDDNTAGDKPATTTGTTVNTGVSYFPRSEWPNLTLAYLFASNANGRSLTDSLYAIDDHTNRVLVQIGKTFDYGPRHNASLSVSTSARDDHTWRGLNTNTTTVALTDAMSYTLPLQTTGSVTVNSSTFVLPDSSGKGASTSLTYTTLYLSGQYRLDDNRWRLNASLTPTFGDIQRILVDAGAQYFIVKNLSAQAQLTLFFNRKLFNNPSTTNDVIWSLILRADV